jgi:hypothetical protein
LQEFASNKEAVVRVYSGNELIQCIQFLIITSIIASMNNKSLVTDDIKMFNESITSYVKNNQ